jgi:hypothetical protein
MAIGRLGVWATWCSASAISHPHCFPCFPDVPMHFEIVLAPGKGGRRQSNGITDALDDTPARKRRPTRQVRATLFRRSSSGVTPRAARVSSFAVKGSCASSSLNSFSWPGVSGSCEKEYRPSAQAKRSAQQQRPMSLPSQRSRRETVRSPPACRRRRQAHA